MRAMTPARRVPCTFARSRTSGSSTPIVSMQRFICSVSFIDERWVAASTSWNNPKDPLHVFEGFYVHPLAPRHDTTFALPDQAVNAEICQSPFPAAMLSGGAV